MIKILFPPGCYGHYVTNCVYHYTNLNTESSILEFDQTGSSHGIRSKLDVIECGHYKSPGCKFVFSSDDILVTILPVSNRCLDYYNNQFVKQNNSAIVEYILTQSPEQEVETKLSSHWNYQGGLNEMTPKWILREWFSFWINQCWKDGYDRNLYSSVPAVYQFDTDKLFTDFVEIFYNIADKLNLEVVVSREHIAINHNLFQEKQVYHNSQHRCEDWCRELIGSDSLSESPCQTIFDESYVQYFLRCNGYEIQCDGLNTFPTHSNDLRERLYKI